MNRPDLRDDLAFILFSQDSPAPTLIKKASWLRDSQVKQEYLDLAGKILESNVIERIRAEALATAARTWDEAIKAMSETGVSDRDLLDGGVQAVLRLTGPRGRA